MKSLVCGSLAMVFMGVFAGDAKEYMVIDVSGGQEAESFEVSYLEEAPEDGWSDEFKTDKIVLRHMKPGGYVQRRRQSEYPFVSTNAADVVRVSVDTAFYIGVFPVTQRQWELVMGTRPSYFKNDECYAKRPVESVTYDMIRGRFEGSNFPRSRAVDANSFLGVLRKKTGVKGLDLPTEAMWEYACHAGAETEFNSGEANPATMLDLGRFEANGGSTMEPLSGVKNGTAEVGTYKSNLMGLYDMHGNVCEWCLDLADAAAEPGPGRLLGLGAVRVIKGGYAANESVACGASVRYGRNSRLGFYYCGLRLGCH